MTGVALAPAHDARENILRVVAGIGDAERASGRRSRSDFTQGLWAKSPWAIPAREWKCVALRAWNETNRDNIGLISAGVAFYCFLAILPLLGAIVMSYGLIADIDTVVANIHSLAAVMPAEAAELIGKQLLNVVTTSADKKGLGLLLALAISLYGGMNAAGAVVLALNVAYEETDRRGFIALTFRLLIMTLVGVAGALATIVGIAAIGRLGWLAYGLPGALVLIAKLFGYAVLSLVGAAASATLYRYGPDREHARWIWLTPGSLFTGCLWVIGGLGFGAYVTHFGNYDATYGSLGAVVVLLTWLYLSAYVLLLGAELNSELERQTAEDTTDGPPRPIGERGATMADTIPGAEVRPAPVPALAPPVIRPRRATHGRVGHGRGGKDLATSRIASRVGRLIGMPRVSLAPSLLVTGGLMMLRRRGREPLGIALLASGGGLAWLARDKQGSEPDA